MQQDEECLAPLHAGGVRPQSEQAIAHYAGYHSPFLLACWVRNSLAPCNIAGSESAAVTTNAVKVMAGPEGSWVSGLG